MLRARCDQNSVEDWSSRGNATRMKQWLTATIVFAACGGPDGAMDPNPDGTVCTSSMVDGDVCVDPRRGNDAAAGTGDAPVKTIGHALELVGAQGTGRTVFLLDGTYDVPGGERFPLTVPTTITLSGISTVKADTIE